MTSKPYSPPALTNARRAEISNVAARFAEAHNSDPFSYGRSHLHMKRGLELPSDLKALADKQLAAREAAKAI